MPRPFEAEFSDGAGWVVHLNNIKSDHANLLLDYARAYRRVAHQVFEAVGEDFCRGKMHSDMDAYPIVFLYRHAVEAYLKTIIVFGNCLRCARGQSAELPNKIFSMHGLEDLLQSVRGTLCQPHCSLIWIPPIFQTFADAERVIKAVDGIDHDALRYPVRFRDDQVQALLPDGLSFNVHRFTEKMDLLLDLLDNAATRTWDAFQFEGLSHPNVTAEIIKEWLRDGCH